MTGKILCVDDEEFNLDIYRETFEETYEVETVTSAEACLQIIEEFHPDLVILDIMMPGMDGYECCKEIKRIESLQDTPVCFLSAKGDIEDRITGYLSGGDDYLVKPFEPEELLAVIDTRLQKRKKITKVRDEAKQAHEATMQMLTTLGETNAVVSFLQQTFVCNTFEKLADKIIQTHAEWGLEVAIEMRIDDEFLYFYTGGEEIALEEATFNFIREKGRLVDHGSRTAVNYPRITILIRNMPVHDMEYYGRIKDYIAIIAQGADSKIISLMWAQRLEQQQQKLVSIMGNTKNALTQIDAEYKEQQTLSQEILSKIGSQVEASFVNLGLTGEQEEFLIDVINHAEANVTQLFEAGLDLDEKFGAIIQDIEETLSSTDLETEIVVEDETADDSVAFF